MCRSVGALTTVLVASQLLEILECLLDELLSILTAAVGAYKISLINFLHSPATLHHVHLLVR